MRNNSRESITILALIAIAIIVTWLNLHSFDTQPFNDKLYYFLPFIAAFIFTIIAVYGEPNGGLMLINIILIPIAMLILIVNASAGFRAASYLGDIGGTFDYGLFKSVKWWVLFIPILIMIIRIMYFLRKKVA